MRAGAFLCLRRAAGSGAPWIWTGLEARDMSTGELALLTSGFSLAISIFGFVWSIWQKFIYVRPSVQVAFGIYRIVGGGNTNKRLCNITVTNMGPGPVIVHACLMKLPRKWFRQRQLGHISPIHDDPTSDNPNTIGPFSAGLPAKLEPGEVKAFYFPFAKDAFLAKPMTRVGVDDTYGRLHWCKRGDIRNARLKFAEAFRPKAGERLVK
jgi:hypothetical protein